MKKIIHTLSLLLLIIPCVFLFSACDNKSPSTNEITGVTYNSASYDYDGTEKEILVTGTLPEGVSAVYTSNKETNAGTYNATVVLSGAGYTSKTLNATLTINKINYDMTGASWNYSSAFIYNGSEKTISVTGLPSGVTVKQYTNCSKTDAGSYTGSVTFNYDTLNHNQPTIANCSWIINKADIQGITFSNDSVEYDTFEHSIQIIGDVPTGSTVTYTY